MKTPTALEIMGVTGRIHQARRGSTLARPVETYRAVRRALAKAMYRQQKKEQRNG